ncbi:disease resistance protein RPV1-like [Corylus avellana]|uniref:disease resistance protein RPV1-like n=1 Tax=Corylus avellana TaxID=13451 RepID=UPI00286B4CCF|nr:disease resistance protein RPV1-like [Corylus avellana]
MDTTSFPTLSDGEKSSWDHDVFLSSKGEDTRKKFTDHLYTALKQVEICTFRDDEGLERGENISSELLNVIRRSRISIVVFSKGYASSTWCLDELPEIVHYKNTTLLPIFYHVDPLDVQKQLRTFAEAFAKHVEYESRFIKAIVEEVLCKVDPYRLDVAEHPIGIESRIHHIKDLLNLETNDVRIVGIYGMDRRSKTTLAKAIYNEIHFTFEGSSFLSNVKERSEKPNGLIGLQKQLFDDILKMNLKSVNADRGISIIQERICGKRVLVILDDVDDFGNLHVLVKKHWLGCGSKIIITTRDEHLLTQLEVDERYEVEKLNEWESLQLFNWHAFKMTYPNPNRDCVELSIEVVAYAGGLPLALECYNVEELLEQLGNMTTLKTLKAGLTAIKQLPSSFNLLKNLETLEFFGCECLIKSPKFSEASHLKELTFGDKTAIEQLPSSLGDLSNLNVLKLPGFGGPSSSWISPNSSNRMSLLSISELWSLTELDLSERNLTEDEFSEFECLSSLERTYLSRNNFRNLPSCISRLPKLKYLHLSECTSLQSISLPRNVISLTANGCTSLERISILTNESSGSSDLCILDWQEKLASSFDLDNCRKLVEIQNSERL